MNDAVENSNNRGTPDPRQDYMLPASIIIAALLISGAWIYTSGSKILPRVPPATGTATSTETMPGADNLKPVTAADHLLGNPQAPVKIIEYSDLECPYCKLFHPTLKAIMSEYGAKGQVAWVYRHFPLASLHPKAPREAEASECAAELGGNDKFWTYIDRIFKITPSNNGLDPAELSNAAEFVGLDRLKFATCLDSGKYAGQIAQAVKDAENAGAQGTPYSIILAPDGRKFVVNGAEPLDAVRQKIAEALR